VYAFNSIKYYFKVKSLECRKGSIKNDLSKRARRRKERRGKDTEIGEGIPRQGLRDNKFIERGKREGGQGG